MIRKAPAFLLVLLIAGAVLLWLYAPDTVEDKIQRVTDSETVIEELAQPLEQLRTFLATRDKDLSVCFYDSFEYVGPEFDPTPNDAKGNEQNLLSIIHCSISDTKKTVSPLEIWSELLSSNDSPATIQRPTIGVLSGTTVSANEFELETKFEGAVQAKLPYGIQARQTLIWKKFDGDWKLIRWIQTKFELVRLNRSESFAFFEDVTDAVIPNEDLANNLKRSSHQELISKNAQIASPKLTDVSVLYREFNDWESAYQYPAVSVVDFDQDGWDDLFVTDRWQAPHLLRNQGDGTFADATSESGLAIDQLACCTLFADFDNDGDPDAFVCRTLETSQYFENVAGKFKHDPSVTDAFMKFAVSASVVDINADGLLDIYINTYGYPLDEHNWASAFRPRDIGAMEERTRNAHWFLDRAGSPNIVLMNRNGKLQRVEIDNRLGQWKNSYQSQWFDFDNDGDLDVYICNDFAPDELLVNETERGSFELRFNPAPSSTFPDGTMGFGMGTSLGDYNNDGQLDLYVSNMYSKAGNRIIAQLPNVNPRIAISAKGNFLFENTGGKFKQVAGTESGQQPIDKVGWSFGGQFADFNNDGQLDLYVPSGFYTPPQEIKHSGDL